MSRKAQRNKRRKVSVPIASMGDIAFLLIIFFLVCSEVSKEKQNLKAKMPVSEHVDELEKTVAARVSIDQDGLIYLDGHLVENAKDVEWGVKALLANTVSDEQRHVLFKCDAQLPKEIFEPVLQAVAEAGGILQAVGTLPEN
ncbi:MAG: biopolymer transporter ExbD [Lentisphaeria bacterium]|nr:biopolymer transporter ExbD [Lentisphaeria bacterium]